MLNSKILWCVEYVLWFKMVCYVFVIVDDECEERDRLVSWIYLIVVGFLEIGWFVGLKML